MRKNLHKLSASAYNIERNIPFVIISINTDTIIFHFSVRCTLFWKPGTLRRSRKHFRGANRTLSPISMALTSFPCRPCPASLLSGHRNRERMSIFRITTIKRRFSIIFPYGTVTCPFCLNWVPRLMLRAISALRRCIHLSSIMLHSQALF